MYKTTGTVIQYDEALNSIIDTTTKAEIIAEGFEWSEGPVVLYMLVVRLLLQDNNVLIKNVEMIFFIY